MATETATPSFRDLVTRRTEAATALEVAKAAVTVKSHEIVQLIPGDVRARLQKVLTINSPLIMRQWLEAIARGEENLLEIHSADFAKLGFDDFRDAWQTVTAWKKAWEGVVDITFGHGFMQGDHENIYITLTMPESPRSLAANTDAAGTLET